MPCCSMMGNVSDVLHDRRHITPLNMAVPVLNTAFGHGFDSMHKCVPGINVPMQHIQRINIPFKQGVKMLMPHMVQEFYPVQPATPGLFMSGWCGKLNGLTKNGNQSHTHFNKMPAVSGSNICGEPFGPNCMKQMGMNGCGVPSGPPNGTRLSNNGSKLVSRRQVSLPKLDFHPPSSSPPPTPTSPKCNVVKFLVGGIVGSKVLVVGNPRSVDNSLGEQIYTRICQLIGPPEDYPKLKQCTSGDQQVSPKTTKPKQSYAEVAKAMGHMATKETSPRGKAYDSKKSKPTSQMMPTSPMSGPTRREENEALWHRKRRKDAKKQARARKGRRAQKVASSLCEPETSHTYMTPPDATEHLSVTVPESSPLQASPRCSLGSSPGSSPQVLGTPNSRHSNSESSLDEDVTDGGSSCTWRSRCASECSEDSISIIFCDESESNNGKDFEEDLDWSGIDSSSDTDDEEFDICYVDACIEFELDFKNQGKVGQGEPKKSQGRKVCFASDGELAEVHLMLAWDYAYRQARCGPWETMARDRMRFNNRVERLAETLDPVLKAEHREKVYEQRFKDSLWPVVPT